MKGLVMIVGDKSKKLLAITRSKAKMYEYDVPLTDHITIIDDLNSLYDITIGIIGEYVSEYTILGNDIFNSGILFSAKYFDALMNTDIDDEDAVYCRLLGAAAFYLNGFPGSSRVLESKIVQINLNSNDLEKLLLALLRKEPLEQADISNDSYYCDLITKINNLLKGFYANGVNPENIQQAVGEIKNRARVEGADRELLFADIIFAVCMKYINISVWTALPKFSEIDAKSWSPFLTKMGSIKELWPSQVLLGEMGVLKGESAIVQMPTSSGKTKASELILRSSFLSGRSKYAVVVAPFRALCQEIYNDLEEHFKQDENINVNLASDVMQYDLSVDVEGLFHILILTPEKLEYILRHSGELAENIGLIIYDEGHLLDDESRGVKYELLLSSLKKNLSSDVQVVLISAVMPNTEEIGKWLIDPEYVSISSTNIASTTRNVAFVSWREALGRLYFVNEKNVDEEEFWVPRILQQQELSLRNAERVPKFYPQRKQNKYNSSHIASCLGCRLVQKGAVAIFCGRKDSVLLLGRELVDAFERGIDLPNPREVTNTEEFEKLRNYIKKILGENSVQAKLSLYGAVVHHGDTPHGLRLCIEDALKKQHAKFVICTSTLAQGVNLPIRYLIITTDRQGRNRIKVRDFHNLMGRVGRSGIFTEGTVIFSDHRIYDCRTSNYNKKWLNLKELLDYSNSESCRSQILDLLVSPPVDEDERSQWEEKNDLIKKEISNYLLKIFSDVEVIENLEELITELLSNTLAFNQVEGDGLDRLKEIFVELAEDILTAEPSVEKRKVFSRSILNLNQSQELLDYFDGHVEILSDLIEPEDLLKVVWPKIYEFSTSLPKTINEEKLLNTCLMWIRGSSFPEILEYLNGEKVGTRNITMDHVVNICENGFGFGASLILGACAELFTLVEGCLDGNEKRAQFLQKRLKYGLPSSTSIILYEFGFIDRNLPIDIMDILNINDGNLERYEIYELVKQNVPLVSSFIEQYYPSYFLDRLQEMNIS